MAAGRQVRANGMATPFPWSDRPWSRAGTSEPVMPRVVIVGAGISGLTLAYRLEQNWPGCEVVVLEQRSQPGGTINTLTRDGFRIEAGPNGFLDNNPATIDLCRELGL